MFSLWEGKDRGTGTRLRAEEKQELKRRELAYRGSYSEPEVRGKTVILIDDGIAAGSAYRELRSEVDELVALMRPEPFFGVGASYEDFSQMSDAEVIDLLERARSFLTRRRRRG